MWVLRLVTDASPSTTRMAAHQLSIYRSLNTLPPPLPKQILNSALVLVGTLNYYNLYATILVASFAVTRCCLHFSCKARAYRRRAENYM